MSTGLIVNGSASATELMGPTRDVKTQLTGRMSDTLARGEPNRFLFCGAVKDRVRLPEIDPLAVRTTEQDQ